MMAAVSVDRERCSATAPSWCSWMPFADYFAACKPLTPEELEACQRLELGPAMSTAAVESAIARGREATAAYCRMHPDECRAYLASVDCPSIASAFGPQTAAAAGCGGGEPSLLYWIAAGLGLVALIVVLRR
jgi:hypothetical protein